MKMLRQGKIRSTLRYLWIFSIIVLAWQGFSSYAKLPEKLATHFDMSGNPDGWSSRKGFFTGWYLLILGMNVLWLLSVMLMSHLLTKKKMTWMVNMPNKDYWLETDERSQEFVKRINTILSGVAFFTNLMWAAIYHIIIQSNIETRFHLNMWAIWITACIMLGFTFTYLLTAFRKPEDSTTIMKED